MRTIIPCLLLALVGPAPAAAQSFLGYRALGQLVLPSDGRSIGAGNLGIGLVGTELSASDPAAATNLVAPAITFTMQPTWGSFEVGDESGTSNTTRFPLIALGFPFTQARGIATLSLAGYVEQRWVGTRTETVELGGEPTLIEDTFETNGGASVARLGWAQRIGPRLSVGATAGAYLGRRQQYFDRSLDSLSAPTGVLPYSEIRRWRYGGYTLAGGISADPHDLLHLSVAVEWSSDLKENPRPGTLGPTRSYSVPLRLSAGATTRLTSRLLLNGSAAYQDWSAATGFEDGAVSTLKYSYGGGLEWRAVQRETRSLPVRLGYRRLVPPFRYGAADPVETIWSLGVGLNLVELEGTRHGWMDLAVERGSRSSAPLSERFWRATISVGISSR